MATLLSIKVAGVTVKARDTLNLLGVTLDRLLHFGQHCKKLNQRTRPRLTHLRRLTGRDWGLEEKQLRTVANGYVRGALEHAAEAWLPSTPPSHVEVLEREMRAAARIITGCVASTRHTR
ncbi:Retrovirus-related Pol polyprotein from type-1 retrotransposable element R1 4 [Amphibalanus amphitrite]|uniref:Retrovirus-related Pol polyprotein from type-1 retrotransposable element R1 4 n=1 Tax=Amphibalanus amphitrite TaxID=1232801 RepID=A0A6A4VJM4_AMPAM|nr:Retrovirus-related Pol polyprotein from type-1 retrotransposable element R1 4 [Amphibalanus amphitrite]